MRILLATLQRQLALGNLIRALQLAAEAYERSDAELRYHLRELVGWIGATVSADHEPATLPERLDLPPPLADRLEVREPPPQASAPLAAGEALTLMVDVESGEAFIGRLMVDIAGSLDHAPARGAFSFTDALDAAVQSVFRYLLRQTTARPHPALLRSARFLLVPQREQPMFIHEGGSIGLAAAVALYGAWIDKAPASDLLLSGSLTRDGKIRAVAHIEDKVRCALRERPSLRVVVVPSDNVSQLGSFDASRIHPVERIDELLQLVFREEAAPRTRPQAVDVDSSLRYGLRLYEQSSAFAAAAEVFDQVAATLDNRADPARDRDLFVALWRGGSCRLHLGQLDEAEDRFAGAVALDEKLWTANELSPEHHFGFCGNRAVLLRDRLAFDEARQLLLTTLSQQRQLRQDKRQLAKTLGNLGELLTFAGRFDEAEAHLLEALDFLRAVYPDEVPRELYYLGNLSLMRGDPAAAVRWFEQGQSANVGVEHGAERNAAFLSYGLARARLATGDAKAGEAIAGSALSALPPTEPYPRQSILKVRGLCHWALGSRRAAERDLDAAADPTWSRGALMRFVVTTADGEHALLLLREQQWPRAVDLARRFASAARGVVDRGWPQSISERTEVLVSRRESDELATLLRRALSLLPY